MFDCFRRRDGGEGGLLDDILQDAGRQAIFASRVREARRRRVRDDQGGTADCRRVQDAGVVSEDAWRSSGGTSDARNAKIFNIFSLVKIGERSGMGLSQLYGNWEETGYARPQLSESFNPERTKVEIEVEVAEKVAENLGKVAENSSQVAEKVAENRREYTEKPSEYTEKYTEKQTEKSGEYTENMAQSIANLTETEERIVAILRQNKFATQGGISAQLGITRTYITKIMGGLQSRNIIRRIGPDKGGYWEVLPQ